MENKKYIGDLKWHMMKRQMRGRMKLVGEWIRDDPRCMKGEGVPPPKSGGWVNMNGNKVKFDEKD